MLVGVRVIQFFLLRKMTNVLSEIFVNKLYLLLILHSMSLYRRETNGLWPNMLQIECEIKRRDQHEKKNKFHRYPAKVGHLGEKSLVVQKSGMKNEKELVLQVFRESLSIC